MWPYLKNIIQLVFSPDHGWEDVAKSSSPQRAFKFMTVMLAIAALSPLCNLLYPECPPKLAIFQSIVIIFASYWATFFIGEFVLGNFLPRGNGYNVATDTIRSFTAYVVGLLSIQTIIDSILPLPVTILQLWPIYVVVIIWRGMMSFFNIPETLTGRYLLVTIPALVLPAQIIMRLFFSNFTK